MAFSTSSYHNNNAPGNIDLARFNIRESVTKPNYALGTRVNLSDGRSFRYANFGEATTRALVVGTDISESSSTATTSLGVIAPASSNVTSDGTAGQRFVQFTLASMAVNELAGGYFSTSDETGEGFTYRIRSNTATSTPATGDVRIELYDKIEVAVGSDTAVFIVGNLYANLESADGSGTTDNISVGVTTAVQAADDFGWVQTWGPGSVLGDGAITIGAPVALSDNIAGAVETVGKGSASSVADHIDQPILGYAMHTSADTEHVLTYLQITP